MAQHPGIRTAFCAGVLVIAAALCPGSLLAGELAPQSPGVFALELRGAQVGLVHSASGGEVSKDLGQVSKDLGQVSKDLGQVSKDLGQVGAQRAEKYRDIALEVGAGMSPAVYDWIAAAWQGKTLLTSGAVLLCNSSHEVLSRREFTGILSETTVPALDVAGKEPAYLAIKLQPENSRSAARSGKVNPAISKPWTRNAFRLDIPGLDCSHVRKIDAMTVTSTREKTEFPHITITLPEADADSWRAWFESQVARGGTDDKQKNGELVFLSPDMATELGRIHLSNLGIFSIQTTKVAAASDPVGTVIVRLYCESMAFDWKAATPAH